MSIEDTLPSIALLEHFKRRKLNGAPLEPSPNSEIVATKDVAKSPLELSLDDVWDENSLVQAWKAAITETVAALDPLATSPIVLTDEEGNASSAL